MCGGVLFLNKILIMCIMEVLKDRKIIDRILDKAVEQILPSRDMLEERLLSGDRLKIYQGFDPTADTLHIGHSVMMHKLEDFRKLGHEVIFLMGNFTALIGDPSDKKATRQPLTIDQTNANLAKYKEQAGAIIDVDNAENPVTILYNYDWLSKLNFADIIELASKFTVQQMLKRKMFANRLEEDKPIGLHEFLYPLMQGYDSVAMDVDIEVGGNDQLFNMMAGRTLMSSMSGKEKIVMTGKLLTTSDGAKMGKSEGNMIKLSDSPRDIYGKVMAFPDEHIVSGFELLTSATLDKVSEVKKELESGKHPMELKKELAFRLTSELKGEEGAKDGQKFFEDAFQNKDLETADVDKYEVSSTGILDILVEIEFAQSKGAARRLVDQGAVSIDGEKVADWKIELSKDGVLKAGKNIGNISIK
jgi:tyrosyl-tRNA synthetase